MIRNIVSDIGGVILKVMGGSIFAGLRRELPRLEEELYQSSFGSKEWQDLLNLDLISEEAIWERVKNELNAPEDIIEWIRRNWRSLLVPNYETIQILESLKTNYKIYGLSNVDKGTVRYLQNRYDLYKIFDDIVCSCKVGMKKPDIEIYKLAIERFGLMSEESIFIDDVKQNLLPAEGLGFKTILFQSPAQLKEDLLVYGVKV